MNKVKRRRIEAKVNSLWTDYALKPGFDIKKELLDKLDLKYIEKQLDNISGLIVMDGKLGKAVISVNKADSGKRKRFSYAHELGHYFFHNNQEFKVDKVGLKRDISSSLGEVVEEIEANFFAACLLMPEEEVLSRVDTDISIEDNASQLAVVFKVSEMAMGFRLKYLGFY